jgi:hypothetical protein
VIGGGREWLKNLPFEGEVKEDARSADEEVKTPIRPKRTWRDSKRQMKVRVQKYLHKNKELNFQISEFLNLVNENIINKHKTMSPYNSSKESTDFVNSVKEIKVENSFDGALTNPSIAVYNKEESIIMVPNIVTIKNSIISHASRFNLYYQELDQFIICLEKYKKKIKRYLRRSLECSAQFRKFRRDLLFCKDMQDPFLGTCMGSAEEKCWKELKKYFTALQSDVVIGLKELDMSSSSIDNFPFLNIRAVNRLSAILRALKFCSDKSITFDTFKTYITNHVREYLKERRAEKLYPNVTELEYLRSIKNNMLTNEIADLCAALIEEHRLPNFEQEEILEMEAEIIKLRNDELKRKVTERILSRAIVDKRVENKDLLENYEEYIQIRKRKKEETENCCSTEYIDKRIVTL